MKKLGISIAALAGLMAATGAASAQVFCVPPLMISAAIVAAQENRELTQREAMWCGLVRDQVPAKKVKVTKKKVAKTEKRQ
jgi:predicted cobalt transporter CbtA